jgi:sulfur-oxidizing protein SoxA
MLSFPKSPKQILLWMSVFIFIGSLDTKAIGQPASNNSKDSTNAALAEYRQMLQEANPADLYVAKGQALWSAARGPKAQSLQTCDLGLGPGIVKGAWVQMPRYFADTQRVQDLESRLVTCMQEIQGFNAQELIALDFSKGERSNISQIAAYVASESQGLAFKVPQTNPLERRMYEAGRELFYMRAGTHDFACASCHTQEGRRIRLQDLPNLSTPTGAGFAFGTWPAYRISNGSLWTMQQRLADCFRQQRFPKPKYVSPATIALSVFMGVNANGELADAPGLKR